MAFSLWLTISVNSKKDKKEWKVEYKWKEDLTFSKSKDESFFLVVMGELFEDALVETHKKLLDSGSPTNQRKILQMGCATDGKEEIISNPVFFSTRWNKGWKEHINKAINLWKKESSYKNLQSDGETSTKRKEKKQKRKRNKEKKSNGRENRKNKKRRKIETNERDNIKQQLDEVKKKLEKYQKIIKQNQITIISLKEQIKNQSEQEEQNQKQILILEEDVKSKDNKILELQVSNKEKENTLIYRQEVLNKQKKEIDTLTKRNQKMALAMQAHNIIIK